MTEPEAFEGDLVVGQVASAFTDLNIAYHLGGSFASAFHGIARATMDADFVVDLQAEHVEPLVRRLGEDYYADALSIHEAIRRRASVNLLHLPTMFKIDLFILRDREWDRRAMSRAEESPLREGDPIGVAISTAEDVILAKLEWYRKGGEVSDRQWRDVLGILQVQAGQLDLDYMKRSAIELGVDDLFDRSQLDAAGR